MQITKENIISKSKKLSEPDWLLGKRLAAFGIAEQMPVDIIRYGLNIHADMRDIDFQNIDFQDSQFEVRLKEKNKKIMLLPFIDAVCHSSCARILETSIPTHPLKNHFAAFCKAYFNHGYVLVIPENSTCDKPIELIISSSQNALGNLIIFAGENTIANIIIRHDNEFSYRSMIVNAVAEKNANLSISHIQKLSPSSYLSTSTNCTVHEDARIDYFDIQGKSATTQALVNIDLAQEGATGNIYGVFNGTENELYDIHHTIKHKVSKTHSEIKTKGALNNKSKAIYQGSITIGFNAQDCTGSQSADMLLLSKEAEINAIPDLGIANNNVQCSHAVSISKINDEHLFYTTSRGIKKEEAKKLLLEAHFNSILEMNPDLQ